MKPTVAWRGGAGGQLELLDQTRLPATVETVTVETIAVLVDAIRRLVVRGAPAIGVAAAYGMVLGTRERLARDQPFATAVRAAARELIAARPTAVNLAWAVERVVARGLDEPSLEALLDEAHAIHHQDRELCRRIGEHGAPLVVPDSTVITICNTGRLATGGEGTALAVLFEAWRRGTRFRVLACETRPLLQGSRLTAFELADAGIPVEVIADAAAAGLIARGAVQLAITGADRIAANGDVANKVGTYALALAAAAHRVPFYVAAPSSTFDLSLATGAGIPIEERDPAEILYVAGTRIAAAGAGARNPAFDVTPAALIRGLVTDRGTIAPVTPERIKAVLA